MNITYDAWEWKRASSQSRWFSSRQKTVRLRHIARRSDGMFFEGLCGAHMHGQEVGDDGGNPCQKCLEVYGRLRRCH